MRNCVSRVQRSLLLKSHRKSVRVVNKHSSFHSERINHDRFIFGLIDWRIIKDDNE